MSEYRKKIVHNFISLSLVQGLSILFPIITFPYLLRVLGVEGFGLFTFIQTFIMYVDMLVTFGFGLTATQRIAANINDPAKTRRIISTVYVIKTLLFLSSLVVFLICTLFIKSLQDNFLLIGFSSLYLLGNLLFPDWFFQGIQKMRNITIVTLISKSLSLLMIILLVKKQTDISYAFLAFAMGNLTAGIIGFYLMSRLTSVKLFLPDKKFIVLMFRESVYVFTSIILAPLYSSVNIFILQALTNPLMVGYYAISEKIVSAIAMLTNVANRTFYPHLSQLYLKTPAKYVATIRKIMLLFFCCFAVVSVAIYFGAEDIIRIISGKVSMEELYYPTEVLKIISMGLLFSPYVSFFFQVMIIQGQKKAAIGNIIMAIFFNLAGGSILSYYYGAKGMAVNLCCIVFIIALLNFISSNKKQKIFSF